MSDDEPIDVKIDTTVEPDDDGEITYIASPTAKAFHSCDSMYKGIRGPIGSGKSTICVMELFSRAMRQKPWNGVRSVRYAIIRNSYPSLIQTSMATWKEWVPEFHPDGKPFCPITMSSPICGRIKHHPLPDGTFLDMEVYFLACDREEDVKKLKSFELTAVWINEASEIIYPIVKMAGGRINRYPAKKRGGPTWSAVIMDTNPPDMDSWWYKLAEEQKPKGFSFFAQPPAILPIPRHKPEDAVSYVPNQGQVSGIPAADNVENHTIGYNYWLNQTYGADEEWIKVFLMGDYGTTQSGKPVYHEYKDSIHCAKEPIEVMRGLPVVVGIDLGLTPATVFSQMTTNGRVQVIDELTSTDMGIRTFIREQLRPRVKEKYYNCQMIYVVDPAGNQRDNDEMTALSILHEEGIDAQMCSTNLFKARREAVAYFLTSMRDGGPCFLLSPTCKMLRKGFASHYVYETRRLETGVTYGKNPVKNEWSHISDACQYACVYFRGGYNGSVGGHRIDGLSPIGTDVMRAMPKIESVSWDAWS